MDDQPPVPDSPSLCSRCAGLGRTCCQNTRVFVTLGDLRRLRASAGDGDFVEYALPADGERLCGIEYDAAWSRIFAPDGRRRVLAHLPDGDCRFLTSSGCSLPESVRPLVCRLYPFDYNETAIKGVHGHLCPRPEADSAPLLLALLAMNREKAEEWRKMLYREILEEFPDADDNSPGPDVTSGRCPSR